VFLGTFCGHHRGSVVCICEFGRLQRWLWWQIWQSFRRRISQQDVRDFRGSGARKTTLKENKLTWILTKLSGIYLTRRMDYVAFGTSVEFLEVFSVTDVKNR
jgi:hypothetical protein